MAARVSVEDLIASAAANLGSSAATDQLYEWFEEEYLFFREKAWVWNWNQTKFLTYGAETEPDVNFSWVEGNDYVTASAAVTLPYTIAGRMVLLGEEWYRVTDYGLTSTTRVYVDRQILGSNAGPTPLSFCRVTYAVRSCRIRNVWLDGDELGRVTNEVNSGRLWQRFWSSSVSSGNPIEYTDEEASHHLDPPSYAPTVTTTGAGTQARGDYDYFYTVYDTESRIESAPGPVTRYRNTDGFAPSVIYSNPAGNFLEKTSYRLRLWRSLKTSTTPRKRPPMWLLQERSPAPTAFTDTIRDLDLVAKERFYNGAFTILRLRPPPDATRHSLVIEHVDCWYGRPYEKEYVPLGRNNEFAELFRVYAKGVLDLQSGDFTSQLTAQIRHRQQVEYLLTKSTNAAEGTPTAGSYYPAVPGGDDSNWVDYLPWKN